MQKKRATELEIEVINRFVRKEKRDRLVSFVQNPKARHKIFGEIDSPAIFDPCAIEEISGSDRNKGILPKLYKERGMGGRVYVISENAEWDAQTFQMSYIVDQSAGACLDTIGYCWKTKIGFYEWHHSGASYLLKRNDKA